MSNWIKTAGISGAILLGLAFVAGLGFVAFFPDLSNDLSAQADGRWGSIFVIIALIITLLKQIIGFIGFLTTIIKIGILLMFVALFLGIGIMILRTWKSSKTSKE
jgi:hypothetical protein